MEVIISDNTITFNNYSMAYNKSTVFNFQFKMYVVKILENSLITTV